MLSYYPTLRAKPGEFAACGRLAARYQAHVCPRFVVPPPTEADPELGRKPTPDEIAHMMGDRLGKSWPHRRAFLDPQFAVQSLGDDGLAKLFKMARAVNPHLLPVLRIDDLGNPARVALLRDGAVRGAIYLDFEEVDPATLVEQVRKAGLQPEWLVLFVDFTGAPLGEDFAPAIAEIFDQLDGVALWNKIVYQASAYPEKLPVGPNEQTMIPRLEWTTFLAALKETGVQSDRLAYGDFGADCGRMAFPIKKGKGGARPKPHLRYTGRSHTFVVRGSDTGAPTPAMRAVCQKIVDSQEFSGRAFSYADDRIWRNAKGLSNNCGDSSAWRELNTAHHLVRVVHDLGAIAGKSFADDEVAEFTEQNSFAF